MPEGNYLETSLDTDAGVIDIYVEGDADLESTLSKKLLDAWAHVAVIEGGQKRTTACQYFQEGYPLSEDLRSIVDHKGNPIAELYVEIDLQKWGISKTKDIRTAGALFSSLKEQEYEPALKSHIENELESLDPTTNIESGRLGNIKLPVKDMEDDALEYFCGKMTFSYRDLTPPSISQYNELRHTNEQSSQCPAANPRLQNPFTG